LGHLKTLPAKGGWWWILTQDWLILEVMFSLLFCMCSLFDLGGMATGRQLVGCGASQVCSE
jgi:hypothetical protein